MQNIYAGDIGDFGKFGLLRALAEKYIIGINWYDPGAPTFEQGKDGEKKNNDGKYRDFTKVRTCDGKLAESLETLKDSPSIKKLEELKLIKNAVYFGDTVPRGNEERAEWRRKAFAALKNCDIVFLDPDNGLLCKSVSEGSAKSVKYTYYKEVSDYLTKKSRIKAVIIYNHRRRKPEDEYFGELIDKLCAEAKADKALIQTVTFRRWTVRDYFIISRDEKTHRSIEKILKAFTGDKWGEGRSPFCHMNCHISSK